MDHKGKSTNQVLIGLEKANLCSENYPIGWDMSVPWRVNLWNPSVWILPGFEGTKTGERVFPYLRLCLSDFSSSNDLFSNDSIILCTAHNGWPPPWRFGILKKGPKICKLLGHYLQKEVSHLALYNSLILLIDVKTSNWPNGNQQLFWINWRRLTIPVVVNIRRSQIEIFHHRS